MEVSELTMKKWLYLELSLNRMEQDIIRIQRSLNNLAAVLEQPGSFLTLKEKGAEALRKAVKEEK